MSEFREFLDEQLQDPEFKEEYENVRPKLSERTGITQADISRVENGT